MTTTIDTTTVSRAKTSLLIDRTHGRTYPWSLRLRRMFPRAQKARRTSVTGLRPRDRRIRRLDGLARPRNELMSLPRVLTFRIKFNPVQRPLLSHNRKRRSRNLFNNKSLNTDQYILSKVRTDSNLGLRSIRLNRDSADTRNADKGVSMPNILRLCSVL